MHLIEKFDIVWYFIFNFGTNFYFCQIV